MKSYEGLITALREVFSIFNQLAESIVIMPGDTLKRQVEDVLQAAMDESTIEYSSIVEQSIVESKTKKQVIQSAINKVLEYVDFGAIAGDAMTGFIANFLRNESYVTLSSFRLVPLPEAMYAAQAGNFGHPLGDDFPKKQFATRRRITPGNTSNSADINEDWKLITIDSGEPVSVGDEIISFRGIKDIFTGGAYPGSHGSNPNGSGRVYVKGKIGSVEYFPGVYGLKWINEQTGIASVKYYRDEDANVANQADNALDSINTGTTPEEEIVGGKDLDLATKNAVDNDGIVEMKTWIVIGENNDGKIVSTVIEAIDETDASMIAKSQGILPFKINEDENYCKRCGSTSLYNDEVFGKRCKDCGTTQDDLDEKESVDPESFKSTTQNRDVDVDELGQTGPAGEVNVTSAPNISPNELTEDDEQYICRECGIEVESLDDYCPDCGSPNIKSTGGIYGESHKFEDILNIFEEPQKDIPPYSVKAEGPSLHPDEGKTAVTIDPDYTGGEQNLAGKEDGPKVNNGVAKAPAGHPDAKPGDVNNAQIIEKLVGDPICPECGSDNIIYDPDGNSWPIECGKCGWTGEAVDFGLREINESGMSDLMTQIEDFYIKLKEQGMGNDEIENSVIAKFSLAGEDAEYMRNLIRQCDIVEGKNSSNKVTNQTNESLLDIINQHVDEALDPNNMTPGLTNALTKVGGSDYSCPACGFNFPKYPGSYPKTCPNCGTLIVKPKTQAGDTEEATKALKESSTQDEIDKLIETSKPIPADVVAKRGQM